MDKGVKTALKLAGYSVRKQGSPTKGGHPCWEWLLNVDSNWEYEAESDYFFNTQPEAWEAALKHLQTGESE